MLKPEQLTWFCRAFVAYANADIDYVHKSNVHISKRQLAHALKEACTDLRFLEQRRSASNGLSEGKIAGVILFRLCKRRIVNLNKEADELGAFEYTQERAAILTVLKFLRVDIERCHTVTGSARLANVPVQTKLQTLGKELLFQITSRHHNQESLGIFFEALCHIAEATEQIERLRRQVASLTPASGAPRPQAPAIP